MVSGVLHLKHILKIHPLFKNIYVIIFSFSKLNEMLFENVRNSNNKSNIRNPKNKSNIKLQILRLSLSIIVD